MECVGEGWDHRSSPSTYPPRPTPMPMFEIAVSPSIAKNLCMYRTPETDRRRTQDPAMSVLCGSITHDQKHGNMPLEWSNEEDFHAWLAAKESEHGIELVVSNTVHSESPLWREQHILRCAREWTGGVTFTNLGLTWTAYLPVMTTARIHIISHGLTIRWHYHMYDTDSFLGSLY